MTSVMLDPLAVRETEWEVGDLFVARMSSRALSGDAASEADLMGLFEAARWAPSSYNNQPWRFVYARRDTPAWDAFFDLLAEGNQRWCHRAGALIVVLSKTTFDRNDQPARTHSLDTGMAIQNLALEGARRGLVVHAMQGFDYGRAREVVGAPEVLAVEVMIAVGNPGNPADLPEKLRDRERPSGRKPLAEVVFAGRVSPPDR